MSEFVNLSILPIIVIDNILSYFDRIDLYNIALVCRSFYQPTKKYLYRYLCNYETHRELVATTLRREPSLAFYIRTFTSYDPSLLEFLWSQTPLALYRLTLKCDHRNKGYNYPLYVASIHPQCRIECLNFELHSDNEKYLLLNAYKFKGLKRLELIIPEFDWNAIIFSTPYYSLQDIFDALYCPSLESVYITNVDAAWDTLQTLEIGDKLPAFQGLCLRQVKIDEEIGSPCEIMWNILSKFMNRSIYFKIEYSQGYTSFYDLATSYASACQLDPTPLIHWLSQCDHFFGVQNGFNRFSISLQQLSLMNLTKTLEIIKSVDFGSTAMELSLCDFSFPIPFSIIPLLHQNIGELHINVIDGVNVDPDFIPQCIVTLPNLQDIYIYLLYTEELTPASTCTAASYSFRLDPAIRNYGPPIELDIFRGQRPIWKIYDCIGRSRKNTIRYHRPGTARGVGALEREVEQWFHLNRSLKSVGLSFDLNWGNDSIIIS